jgi:E3 ubiquitin-protein ligase synoviolin
MRPELLGLASAGLTMAVLGNAYVKHQQFYPSVVYITKSNPSMAIIYMQFLVIVILMGKIVRKIFFGQLRPAEFEHLMDRSWYAVTETCLAFTVFKDDLSPKFVALFVLLLFLKSFHWLSEDRVDFMERSPSISLLFHVRVLSLCIFLGTLDIIFIQHACHSAMTKGASVQLVFGFEYAIHLTIILNTLIKYILHTIDLNSDAPWENKAVYMLYLELFIGFIKVILYMFFFMIMMRIFTLPLFALRPMYLTMRAFKKALNDVVLSRRAIQLLNTSFPFATEEDLENSDNVCIICRETMTAPACKKLPCNHIFHRSCLRGWFLRQQTCPTCRMDIVRPGQNTSQQNQAGGVGAGAGAGANNNFQQQVAALRQQLDALQQQRQHQQQHQQLPNILNNLLQQQANLGGGQLPGQVPPPMPPATGAAAGPSSPPPPFTGQGAEGGGISATAGGPSLAGRHPPFIPLPPFLMPIIPPPMPPPNFQGMSNEELTEMEGAEREHVEARIRCLRNIQVQR